MKNKEKTLCSICIATYNRPILLKNLLISINEQILPEKIHLEIIVVDNDYNRSAQGVVKKFMASSKINCKYFTQIKKNICLTRNVAVAEASGDYLLFIDDDEYASPKWIYFLIKALREYQADGVFGPVEPEFNPAAPSWIRHKRFFYGNFFENAETGSKALSKWTSNCIVSAELIKSLKEPFSAEYGITGGGDPHLFERLERKGAIFVYCKEAVVYEFLPSSRTRLSYIFMHAIKGGNTFARREIEFSLKRKFATHAIMTAKALAYGAISLIFVVFNAFDAMDRTKWLLKFASNCGKLMAVFRWHYKTYK